jgi:hypothetical protein
LSDDRNEWIVPPYIIITVRFYKRQGISWLVYSCYLEKEKNGAWILYDSNVLVSFVDVNV